MNNNEHYPEWISSSPIPEIQLNGQSFLEYQKNEDLIKILEGKKIAYVGPSSHLLEYKNGHIIDSYDVVIRTGQLSNVTENLKDHYGTRTDIITHSFNEKEIKEAKNNIEFLNKLKFIIITMVSYSFINEHTKFCNELLSQGIKVQNVNDRYIFKLFKEVGTTCNCGYVGLNIILKYKIKELYITGINFYNMGKFGKVYNDEYYESVTQKQGLYDYNKNIITTSANARSDLHNQEQQIKHFQKLYLENKNIIILDEYLKENLFKI